MANIEIVKQTEKMIFFKVDGKNSRLTIDKFNAKYGNENITTADSNNNKATADNISDKKVALQKLPKHALIPVADMFGKAVLNTEMFNKCVLTAYPSTPNYISVKHNGKVQFELDITGKSFSIWLKCYLSDERIEFFNSIQGVQCYNFVDNNGKLSKKAGFSSKLNYSYLYDTADNLIENIINDCLKLFTAVNNSTGLIK